MRHRLPFKLLSLLTFSFAVFSIWAQDGQRRKLDLSGIWQYTLLELPDTARFSGAEATGIASLPGTLDTNGAGIPVPPSNVTTQLSRRHTYTGKALYKRSINIPESFRGKKLTLTMERTRPTTVVVDGVAVGQEFSISAPQRYDLTTQLTPGEHTLEIIVDNGESIPAAVRNSSHACTESTQTNWNGIIGDFHILATDPMHLENVKIIPDIDNREFKISGDFTGDKNHGAKVTVKSGNNSASTVIKPNAPQHFEIILPAYDTPLWSEWDPQLCDITISLEDKSGSIRDSQTIKSGLRKFATDGTNFTINGDITFLRGKHDACVWPMTAHVPMDVDSWRNYFKILKDYGINHVRFHSWCPPEACFQAADEAGIYLQPELTIWGELDNDRKELLDFLDNDMEKVLSEYAHHPSFTMFAIGNELWGDTDIMRKFIDKARELTPGLLSTRGSNIYLGYNGQMPGDDFLVTCRVGPGDGFSSHARASFSFADADNGGIMNSTYPNTSDTFEGAIAKSTIPVVGHETGQYQFYPNYDEIAKYTGALRPDNLATFRDKADKAGTLRKAKKYFDASGKWATKLYLADMDMNLRTKGMGGFQILDLQDYPGQGTALVGILDAFMYSKGFITPEEWRQSCDDVTVLANLPKRCFSTGELVEIPIELVNYSNRDLEGTDVTWELPFAKGTGKVAAGKGVCKAGNISLAIPYLKKPTKMTLSLSADNGNVTNSYDIWIYPEKMKEVKNVVLTTDIDQALALLEKGKRVILMPDSATTSKATLGPLFQTDYWNYRMFRTICENVKKKPSPGTMGLLINDTHPALKSFPTDNHTDWQWFAVAANSYPLIIDRLPASIDPIIEPIDNIERNYRLGLMLECMVGDGTLMIIMADADKLEQYPEGRWFIQSAKEYVGSKECKPRLSLTPRQVANLLTKPSADRRIEELHNISY